MQPLDWHRRLYQELWDKDLPSRPPLKRALVRLARVLYGVAGKFADGELILKASSLAYTSLLSLAPLLAVSFSILKAFGAYNQLEPMLMEFLSPLGLQGQEVGRTLLDFVGNLRVGVLGSVGIAMLFYTVISLIHKTEQAFNEMWHIPTDRSLGRRFSDYLSVILTGPVLIFSAVGLANTALDNAFTQRLLAVEPLGDLILSAHRLVPFLLIMVAFAFLYGFLPNTRVRWSAAMVGSAFASLLWFTSGKIFAHFVVSSSNYSAIYSGFAGAVLFIIWLQLGWLIILVGAQITAYWQNPRLLDPRRNERLVDDRQRERLLLEIMARIAHAHYYNEPPLTLGALQNRYQQYHLNAIEELVGMLEGRRLIVATRDEPPAYLPSRDIETISIHDVLSVVRDRETLHEIHEALPEVTAIIGEIDAAFAELLANRTLKDLIHPQSLERQATSCTFRS
ncbi:MAG: YihY/virulence factor BrkB family protein [Gammaproteobacteria bacterium]|nr:YihY/virulence factor BrkB family protein [Gammaproteobacteria bacterium]MCP5423884.1 YihY/virulence factor BrkB family protein [Gammaproteobacteria bacterium]